MSVNKKSLIDLPNEVLSLIASFLDNKKDRINYGLTNKQLSFVMTDKVEKWRTLAYDGLLENVKKGNTDVVMYMLKYKYPNKHDTKALNECFIESCKYGHLQIVKYLLTLEGLDPIARNNRAIRWASSNGNLGVVKYLVTLDGVDPTAFNNIAICWAAENGHLDVVKFLEPLCPNWHYWY